MVRQVLEKQLLLHSLRQNSLHMQRFGQFIWMTFMTVGKAHSVVR
jgi:hypothetical protein